MEPQDLIDALRNRARKFVSLDTPKDSDLGDMAIDIGAGFLPVIGTAQAGRDFERARREDDKLGMALSSIGMLPVVGGVAGAANKARRGAKAAEAVVREGAMKAPPPTLREAVEKAVNDDAAVTANIKPKVQKIDLDLRTPEGEAAFVKKYGRKPLHTMTEQERVAKFGPAMAETPEARFSDLRSRRELAIPGGIGPDAPPLTLADQAKISAQAIDYNDIDPRLALDIHKRLVQSVDPGPDPSRLELMNRLGFGITSGNAPITKNLLEWSQLRPRSEDEIAEWARYSPVGLNKPIPGEGGANKFNTAVNEAYGVQASGRGGTGVANTANRQYVSELANMLRQNDQFFRRGVSEPEAFYVERLMNQVRGLGPKTGSLGFAMVEPQTSNISAIDRHIADLTRDAIRENPGTRAVYQQQMLNAYNNAQPKSRQAKLYETARRRAGDDADKIEAEQFRNVVSTPQQTKFRDAKTGDVRSTIPAHLRNLPFYEPDQASTIGPMYATALRMIKEGGKPRGIGGFSNQWFDWDFQRSRAEPHAGLNPMATQMERLTPEEYKLVRDTFSEAGAMRTTKNPQTGRLEPLKPTADYRKLIYGKADPALLAVLAGGAGGAATIAALRKKNEDDEEEK